MAFFAAISCVRESRPGGGSNLLVSKQTGCCRRNGRRKESGEIRKGPSCRPPHISGPQRKYSKTNRPLQGGLNVMAGGRSLEILGKVSKPFDRGPWACMELSSSAFTGYTAFFLPLPLPMGRPWPTLRLTIFSNNRQEKMFLPRFASVVE